MNIRIAAQFCIAALLTGAMLPAQASPARDPATVMLSVSVAGLDLTKPSDQSVLRHRTAVAAHKLCEAVTAGSSMTDPGYAACFHTALREASRDVATRIAAARSRNQLAASGTK